MSCSVRKLRAMSLMEKAHINEILDEALNETFLASDSIAVNIELASSTSKSEHRREQEDSRRQRQAQTSL